MASATAERTSETRRLERERTALARAVEREGWARVAPHGGAAFSVTGSRGDTYRVYLRDPARSGEPSCSCPAGRHAMPCWHLLAAVLFLVPPSLRAALG